MLCAEKAGTDAGYQRHRRGKEQACAPCLAAHYEKGKAAVEASPTRRREVFKNSKFKRVYGITLLDYERMVDEQLGKCAICEEDAKSCPKGVLFVDHCHKTGKIRGLLCSLCNFTLGNARDNVEILRSAANYLEDQCER